ncbi:M24 family metallopeptidase [Ornithinibacillus sp. L9]|uniref:M24 family metallopeptidase n=1 Tax=Ornithinibacillus caprae TaxID=2678566 RepID=A0A6N8FCZ3_9BACI|nr:Xaa-Pro peptidase family protein [Ornithinibacillus caprae]MUK87430.1 M24 family metallopeptidase [Ornithinibacillus caprae]
MQISNRVEKLREFMSENKIDLSIIMNFENQYYFSGLKAITYSRPIVLAIDSMELNLIIPSLEESHAKEKTKANNLYIYHETHLRGSEGKSHLEHLQALISTYPSGTRVGVEFSSLPIKMGNILREAGFELVNLDSQISEMRYVKDEEEIKLVTEAGKLVSLALKQSLESTKPGITEMEIDRHGTQLLFEEMDNYPNATLDYFAMSPSGLKRTNMPHVFSNTRKLDENDIVVHSRQVALNGYRAECERTFFVGKPTDKQVDAFNAAYEAQLAALDKIKVGISAKEVDEVARKVFQKAGYEEFSIHRTGHGIGIGLHEEPSLRFDNDLVLKEGMIFTIEPGIYIPGVGGFRHSDTVILTKEGTKLVTEYPRELEKLIY